MIDYLVLVKILVSILLVFSLSFIAEYTNTKVAGILGGFPTGSAISLFFFGYESGVQFAAESAIYNIAGLSSMLLMVYVYYYINSILKDKRIIIPLLSSIVVYFLVSYLLNIINVPDYFLIIITVFVALLIHFLMRKVNNTKIDKKVKLSLLELSTRGGIATLIILSITFAPKFFNSEWSGLFSAFPSTFLPLIIIVHYNYGSVHVASLIKNLPTGIFSLIAYSFSITYLYPHFGVGLGTVFAYLVAFLVLFVVGQIKKLIKFV